MAEAAAAGGPAVPAEAGSSSGTAAASVEAAVIGGFPTHLQEANFALAQTVNDSVTLGRMATVCPGWWQAARLQAGYRVAQSSDVADSEDVHRSSTHGGYQIARPHLLVALSGSRLFGVGADSTVNVWRLLDNDDGRGTPVQVSFGTHSRMAPMGEVCSVVGLPEHGLVATGGDDCIIKLWDMETAAARGAGNVDGQGPPVRLQAKHELEAHRSDIVALAAMPGTDLLASGSIGGRLFLWNVGDSPDFVANLNVYESSVSRLAGLADGLLAVGCEFEKMVVHAVEGGGGSDADASVEEVAVVEEVCAAVEIWDCVHREKICTIECSGTRAQDITSLVALLDGNRLLCTCDRLDTDRLEAQGANGLWETTMEIIGKKTVFPSTLKN